MKKRSLHEEYRKNPPQHVTILGLGPSVDDYVDVCKRLGNRHRYCDETWAINALGDVIKCDLVFHMDDVRIQQIRADAKPESNIASMLEWLKTSDVPVMTSRGHEDYKNLVEFPIEDVINDLTFDYFNSTAAWAVAYAIHIGVKKISLFGCDYTYPNAHHAEKGRACLEFWLGVASARGIKIGLSQNTTLMDAIYDRQQRLYGYDTRQVHFDFEDSGVKVRFEEIETLPTAEEIEAEYDHSKHPNKLMEAQK